MKKIIFHLHYAYHGTLPKSNKQKGIEIDDIDMAFATGVKGLNDENKETLKNIMEGLLAKQELEKNSNNKKE